MKRFIVITAITAVMITIPSFGGRPIFSDLPDNEICTYKCTKRPENIKTSSAMNAMKQLVEEYPAFYTEEVRWEGSGSARTLTIVRNEKHFNDATLRGEYRFRVGNKLVQTYMRRTAKSPDGKLIRDREYDFLDPSLGYPPDTFHFLLLDWVLRAHKLKIGTEIKVNGWFESTLVIPMILRVDGEEKLKIKSGEYDCWKVGVYLDKKKIDDLAGKLFVYLMPQITLYMDKKSPNRMVRFVWPLSNKYYGKKEWDQIIDLAKVGQ